MYVSHNLEMPNEVSCGIQIKCVWLKTNCSNSKKRDAEALQLPVQLSKQLKSALYCAVTL